MGEAFNLKERNEEKGKTTKRSLKKRVKRKKKMRNEKRLLRSNMTKLKVKQSRQLKEIVVSASFDSNYVT